MQAEGPKGQFAVEQIKIAAPLETNIFGKEYPFPFQVTGGKFEGVN